MELTPVEARVIGCLVEKQLTTPQYYPLTLNALVAACNQTSNRNPVVRYDERTVETALATLREKQLTRIVHSVHNRAARYRHVLDEVLGLDTRELALLGVLLLRGAQTPGELRARTERLADFGGIDELEAVLDALADRDEPLVVRLERQPGQKEARYAELLGGPVEPDVGAGAGAGPGADAWTPTRMPQVAEEAALLAEPSGGEAGEVTGLRAEVAALREEVAALRGDVAELRALLD